MTISLKRIYEPIGTQDGYRVLVDRLWPRGISKKDAKIDLWLKEIAPSTALRQWFNHEPAKWKAFKTRYFADLDANQQHVQTLLEAAHAGHLSLIYSSKDTEHNQAVALQEYLETLMK